MRLPARSAGPELLGALEIGRDDLVAGLEPAHAARAGDVEQYAARDDPVSHRVDRGERQPGRADDAGCGSAVVELTLEVHVSERVEVSRVEPVRGEQHRVEEP